MSTERLPHQILLRCYSRPVDGGGRHVAVCLTLNLVAEGATQREAIHKLHALIRAYLEDAIEHQEFHEFVPRRAPLRFYGEYATCKLFHALAGILSIPSKSCAFKDHHPIQAHA